MKKFILLFGLLVATASYNNIDAQKVGVSININIGSQPNWGPVGYDYVDYYYMPDINVYYNVNNSIFYYLNGRRWVSSRYLPQRYYRYNFYSLYKVVINSPNPWYSNSYHCREYRKYKGSHNQQLIRYSNDHRYTNNRNNYVGWTKSNHRNDKYDRSNTSGGRNQNNSSGRNNSSNQINGGRTGSSSNFYTGSSNSERSTSGSRVTNGRSDSNKNTSGRNSGSNYGTGRSSSSSTSIERGSGRSSSSDKNSRSSGNSNSSNRGGGNRTR